MKRKITKSVLLSESILPHVNQLHFFNTRRRIQGMGQDELFKAEYAVNPS